MSSSVLRFQSVKDGNIAVTWRTFLYGIYLIKYRAITTSNMHRNLFLAAIKAKYISQGYMCLHSMKYVPREDLIWCNGV